jgi:gliding motility-associated-like protein
MLFRNLLLIFLLFISVRAICQPQDVDFHLNAHLLTGKKILKVKRDFYDPYLWVLAQNNQVFRVNSLTLAIDNYTSVFAPYNNLKFIDIAGRSQDTVFIASNANSFIHYANGTIKVIGSADGLKGTINSIGIKDGVPNVRQSTANVFIASDQQLYTYNSDSDQLSAPGYPGPSILYQTTYRANFFSDSTENNFSPVNPDTVLFKPVTYLQSPSIIIDGWLVEGGTEFGTDITTADFTFSGNSSSDFTAFFYGDSKGLSQCYGASLNMVDGIVSTRHYLNGIGVNKIADIYGLLSFGANLLHQHLLVGTDNGFYFSSNIFSQYSIFKVFSLFYDKDVGNVRINDISVNALSTDYPVCENAVWLAADDGLYLLKPDYGAYLNSQQLQAASFVNQSDTLSTINICQGDTVAAMVNKFQYPGNSVQWYKNGLELPTQSSDTLSIGTAGTYYAVLYDPCENIHIQSNTLNVNVTNSPIFTFNYPDKIQECNNNPNTLQVTNNPGYHYRWYTNGALNGDTTNSYTVTQSGKYKVEVSACTNSWVPSKEVEVDLINLPVPAVSADKSVYCAEDVATLSVNTPLDASYAINWYQDGNLLAADNNLTAIKVTSGGNYTVTLNSTIAACTQTSTPLPVAFTPAPVFTFNYPDELQYCAGTPLTLTVNSSGSYQYQWYRNDTLLTGSTTTSIDAMQSGKYKAEVSSCAGSWISSKEVGVQFVELGVPVVSFDKAAYCTGDLAVMSENFPPDPSYTINWYCNNFAVAGVTNDRSFTTSVPGDYKAVLVYNTQNSDGSFCQQISASKSLVFNPRPTLSIQQTVNTTLCTGQTVSLAASHSSGTVQWSTGETTDQITVTQTGNYKVTVTSPAGCQADTSINVTFLPDPILSLRDTSICTFKKQVITLTAPPGFATYSWNNSASTSETYPVSQPQTVSLTVTDANGCQATQQIKVADECPVVFIPNTFTPNSDGINDTWVIEGLDETGTVKVFTRWGAEVYQSVGYSTPWNGAYSGKKLPSGVYYYIVTAKNGSQKFSGSLTIIY